MLYALKDIKGLMYQIIHDILDKLIDYPVAVPVSHFSDLSKANRLDPISRLLSHSCLGHHVAYLFARMHPFYRSCSD